MQTYPRIYTRAFAKKALEVVLYSPYKNDPLQDPLNHSSDLEARRLFQAEQYSELADDAELLQLVIYLRGCRGLQVPEQWAPLLPKKL